MFAIKSMSELVQHHITIQLKAYLSTTQTALFENWTDSLRPLYNLALGLLYEEQQRRWRTNQKFLKNYLDKSSLQTYLNEIENKPDIYPVEWHITKALPECDWLTKEENEVRKKDNTKSLACRTINRDGNFFTPIRPYWHLEEPQKLAKFKCFTNQWLISCNLLTNYHLQKLLNVNMKVRQSFISMNLMEAWKRYQKGDFRKLKFKSKRNPVISLCNKQTNRIKFDPEANNCQLLGKEFGLIEFRGLHNRHQGQIQPRNGSLTKKADGYYLNLVFQVEHKPIPDSDLQVGIDPGLVTLLTLSDGKCISNQRFLKENERHLTVLQKKLSRQTPGSKNWEKTKKALAKIHKQTADHRKYYNHKVSTHLVNKYGAIAIEDTKLTNMNKRPKAEKREDGKGYEHNGAKAKAGLNQSFHDAGLGQLRAFLESKANSYENRHIERVRANYTSQKCSRCGHTDSENRLTQASFHCLKCGLEMPADLNAAINIEQTAFGLDKS
ncbi:transposase IS605 OrfB [Rippkaea orientalis PCC 8801]|uniref:Transposase IS605 OrfB n=2 Tax=Rippkaea TaxID=2546365 RepID=B7K606_RIPO1|nr:transposase IS605 OrfB [Rippkaea orientalis PCC 8801]